MLFHDHVVGRHQTSDGVLGVVQERQRNGTLFGAQRVDQLGDDIAGKLFEELCTVVGRHLVQDGGNVFLGHVVQQLLLRL